MPLAKVTAIDLLQALFWLWLAREAVRDRPRGGSRPSNALWRFDAGATVGWSMTMFVASTIGFIVFLAYALRR